VVLADVADLKAVAVATEASAANANAVNVTMTIRMMTLRKARDSGK
jgi:hypothetical protein